MSDEDTNISSTVIFGFLKGFTSNVSLIPKPTFFKKQRPRASWFCEFPNIMDDLTTTGLEVKTLYSTGLLTSGNRFIYEKTIR